MSSILSSGLYTFLTGLIEGVREVIGSFSTYVGDFSLQVIKQSIHTTSEKREVRCECKVDITRQDNRFRHRIFYVKNQNQEKSQGGGEKFTIICRFTRIIGIC